MVNNFKESDSSQGRFISVIPSEQVTEGSFDETVQLLIDHVADLSAFDARYNNAKGGASAYPPSVLLKIILAAYSRGITGSRKIENLCKFNTVFMCLSGFLTPDHSTIAAFVSKQHKQIEDLFVQIVVECDYLGLIGGNCFSIDGTKLSSNASKDKSGTISEFEKKYKKIRNGVNYLLRQHREEDKAGGVDPDRREREKKKIKKLRKLAKDLEAPLREMTDKIGSTGKPKKTNLTDPDSSTLMSGGGGAAQGFMAVAVVDDKHQVISGAGIAHETEQKCFIPMLEQVEENLGISLEGRKMLADAGFNTIENADYCFEREIDAYLADGDMRARNPLYKDRDRKKPESRRRKYFKVGEFSYDEESNSCQCPAGNYMRLAMDDYILHGEHYRKFVGLLNDCRNCSFQKQCMKNAPELQGRQVSIKKDVKSNPPRPYDLMKEKMDSPEGRDIYGGRMGTVEPVFGNIKHNLGLKWLSLRGLEKVTGQWLLFTMVHNMVKIQKYGEYEPV